jgi:hypothetical protein
MAIVIVEPDALAQAECRRNPEARKTRLGLLHYALSSLRSNAPGAKLGEAPHYVSGQTLLGWVKGPGNSDGPCGAARLLRAGAFSPDLAMRLIKGN